MKGAWGWGAAGAVPLALPLPGLLVASALHQGAFKGGACCSPTVQVTTDIGPELYVALGLEYGKVEMRHTRPVLSGMWCMHCMPKTTAWCSLQAAGGRSAWTPLSTWMRVCRAAADPPTHQPDGCHGRCRPD